MIKLEEVNHAREEVMIAADEPVRITAFRNADGRLDVFVYRGAEVDPEQEPIGCFDPRIPDKKRSTGWISESPGEVRGLTEEEREVPHE